MYLWKLTRGELLGYNQVHGSVVAAESSEQAREVAGKTHGDQPASAWYLPSTTVECIGTAADGIGIGIIMEDFES